MNFADFSKKLQTTGNAFMNFPKRFMMVYVCTNFGVYRTFLSKCFSRGCNFAPPTWKPALKSPRKIGLKVVLIKIVTSLINFEKIGCCRSGTKYDPQILCKCGKMVETKSQKVVGANSYVYRSYREKPGRKEGDGGRFIALPHSEYG